MDLQRLTEFIDLTHRFRKISRDFIVHGGGRSENDIEHSYQLALVCWYLAQHDHPELDINRVVMLALVHDLVEIHADDTSIYANETKLASKTQREAQAASKLIEDWPDFPALHECIAEYEACKTPEAKFVYSLDKIVPMLNNYTDNGRNWRQKNASLDWLKSVKAGKADRSPHAAKYYHDLIAKLEESPHLFGK